MRVFAITVLILAVVGTAGAINRSDMINNADPYYPPDQPQHGPQNGDGVVITTLRDATVYYSLAGFLDAIQGDYYLDDFSWLDWGTISGVTTYQFGPVNGYSYTAFAASELFSIPGAMSTNSAEDPLILTFDGLPVTAVAGDFFGTDFNGNPVATVVTVALDDGTTVELTLPTVFVGFTTPAPITTLTISCGGGLWATYDNFYVGQMAIVPVEERSWGLIKALYQ